MQHITEQQLTDLADCPLKTPREACVNPVLAVALETASKALLQAFDGRVYSRTEIREIFSRSWSKRHPAKDKDYWQGLKKAARVARVVRELLEKYEVVLPQKPYSIMLSRCVLKGQFPLLRKRSNNCLAALTWHSHRPLNYFAPKIEEAARWLSMSQDAAVSLNVPLLRGKRWVHTFDASWVYTWLGQVEKPPAFPRPGSHCLSCKDALCLTRPKDVPLWTIK